MRSLYARRGHSTEVAVSGRKMTRSGVDTWLLSGWQTVTDDLRGRGP